MRGIADAERPVIGGVDTHAERHVAAVVNQAGRVLGTEQFPAAAAATRPRPGWAPPASVDSPRNGTTVYEERTRRGISDAEVHPGL